MRAAALLFLALAGCGGGGSNSIAPPGKVLIARTPAQLRWSDAEVYCKNLTAQGVTGWRLPTQPELTEYAQSGVDIGSGAAWSSTPATPTFHYYVSLNSTTGTATAAADTSYFAVRCAHD